MLLKLIFQTSEVKKNKNPKKKQIKCLDKVIIQF